MNGGMTRLRVGGTQPRRPNKSLTEAELLRHASRRTNNRNGVNTNETLQMNGQEKRPITTLAPSQILTSNPRLTRFHQSLLSVSGNNATGPRGDSRDASLHNALGGDDGWSRFAERGFEDRSGNVIVELMRRKRMIQRRIASQSGQRSPHTMSLASLHGVYTGSMPKTTTHAGQSSPLTGPTKRSNVTRDPSPVRTVANSFMVVKSSSNMVSPSMSRLMDEDFMLEREIDSLSKRIAALSDGHEEDLNELLSKNLELYHLFVDRHEIHSDLFAKLEANQLQLITAAKKVAARLKFLREENQNLVKEKVNAGDQVSKLKNKAKELYEINQTQENRIEELETKVEMQRNKSTLGLDMRSLLDENDELKQALREQEKSLSHIKSKEVKLIKLLFYVKKEGNDIDKVYKKYAEEIQNTEDESQFFTESSAGPDDGINPHNTLATEENTKGNQENSQLQANKKSKMTPSELKSETRIKTSKPSMS
eukprot:TRINITY_DN2369_c0_g1_i1.p1 TRINITY_DN2369_c0_g1~~TRINITY_DN2369_c0_g1_i1.p1  ORF type:complete len:480 (-),score=100.77 TRINITY_DN2369_c0_g1_i1:58-1497(-)